MPLTTDDVRVQQIEEGEWLVLRRSDQRALFVITESSRLAELLAVFDDGYRLGEEAGRAATQDRIRQALGQGRRPTAAPPPT